MPLVKRKPRLNALQRRAQRRAMLQRIRKNAPKHPVQPEARIRMAVAVFLGELHEKIKATVLHHAPYYKRPTALKVVEDDGGSDDPMMASVFRDLWNYGKHLLMVSPFVRIVKENAKKTADSAKAQVAKALGLADFDPDLSADEGNLGDWLYDMANGKISDSLVRANEVLEEWDGEDMKVLAPALDEGLDGILGGALALASLYFGAAFGDMNKSAQEDAGVGEYQWVSQHDSAVRPEHLALDGEIASWDDPPLSAEDSSSGEECHAGEDYGCRCTAAPVPPGGLPN